MLIKKQFKSIQHRKWWLLLLLIALFVFFSTANTVLAIPGDLDGDCNVDQDDLNILLKDRNKSVANSACGAPCDLDGDGMITALDARKLVLLCTKPYCTIVEPSCKPNQPPSVAPVGNQNVSEGNLLSFQINGSDPDGDTLTYSATGLPTGAVINPTTGRSSWTPNYQQAGNYTITFTATDPGGLTASIQVNVTVNNVNRSPEFTSTSVTTANESMLYNYQVSAIDPDNDTLTYSLTQAPSGMTIDSATGLISWTPSEIQIGLHNISVQVNDGKGGTDTQSFTISVAATVDRISPVISLFTPSQVQASGTMNIEVQATDGEGVAHLYFYVDNLSVKDIEIGALPKTYSYSLSYNAPDQEGTTLKIRVVAEDGSVNQGEATAEVMVVASPDTNPPVIDLVQLPQKAAPGDSITARCEVKDDRGVADVRLIYSGTNIGADALPPYEIAFTIPSDAAVGSSFVLDVEAEDTSGNISNAQGSLEIVSTKDTNPPTSVSLQAPAESLAGQTVQLNASAVDDVGILKVVFYADGVQIAEDTASPYTTGYMIPEKKAVGSQVVFTAEAVDFSNNKTVSDPAVTKIIAPGEGFILGEVFDDTTGLPVSNATIKVISAKGKPFTQAVQSLTDQCGRYSFSLPEGEASLEITKDVYTSAFRTLAVQRDIVSYPLDVRLTPLGTGHSINRLTGGSININDKQISLYIPPGAFANGSPIFFNTLSGQGLPAMLPVGWTPDTAFFIRPDGNIPNSALELTIRGVQNAESLVAVRWDKEKHQWLGIEKGSSSSGDGLLLSIKTLGTFALVKPDSQPESPAIPEIGNALTGVASQAIPEAVTASILPNPDIIFMQPGAKSNVWVALNNIQPLPSGTIIQVDFNETYERTNGTWLKPESMTQDFILYQGSTGFESHFVASPGEMFDPILLKEGVIKLNAHRPAGADGSGILGPAGGTVTSPDGFSITIPAGALNKPVPVLINAIHEADSGLSGDPRFEFLKGVEVNLGGNVFSMSASLNLNLSAALEQDAQVLVVKAVRAEGITRYKLIGIASINTDFHTDKQALLSAKRVRGDHLGAIFKRL